MNKRLLISLLALTMSFHIVGCTSGDSAQDSEESVVSSDDSFGDDSFSEEGSGDFSEGGEEFAEFSGEGESVDDTALNEEMPAEGSEVLDPAAASMDEASDELALDDGGDLSNEFPDEVASFDQAPVEEPAPMDPGMTDSGVTDLAANDQQPSDQQLFEQPADDQAYVEPPPVADTSTDTATDTGFGSDTASTEDYGSADTGSTDVAAADTSYSEPAPVRTYLPLLKVKDAPYEKNGALLNRYYVARPGDTATSVSERIYGSDRSSDLKSWNTFLNNRSMKVGDKIYYSSPKDPSDSVRMISWYEEQGLSPQVYTAQEGEDIRALSTNLLGHQNSWKEIWATNMDVESKGTLPAGTELRYYPKDAVEVAAAGGMAQPAPAPPVDVAMPSEPMLPPDDPVLNQQFDDVAMNPPPPDMGAAGQVAPPPPPDAAMAPPPPMEPMQAPPPPKPTTRAAAADEEMAGDPDQTMMLGAVGMLLLGGVLAFSVIRRKRASKRIDLTQTQI